MTLVVKETDTHDVYIRITDGVTGEAIDLTGADIEMHVSTRSGPAEELTVAPYGDPADGILVHTLTGDLVPGTYSAVIKMTKSGAQISAPTETLLTFKVVPTLP